MFIILSRNMHALYLEISLMEEERTSGVARYITRVLQREANRAQLAVCPPPWERERERERKDKVFYRREVDRMPINSVRNPLLNPHESSVLVEDLHSYHIHTLRQIQKRRRRSNNKFMGGEEGADGFYLRCDGGWSRYSKWERERGVGVINNWEEKWMRGG